MRVSQNSGPFRTLGMNGKKGHIGVMRGFWGSLFGLH